MYLRFNIKTGFFRQSLIVLACAALLSACSTHSDLPLLDVERNNAGVTSIYQLRVGDKLQIKIFGEVELSGAYEVDAGGNVPFPLVGNVRAEHHSVAQFRENLRRKLANGFLKRPRITVDIVNYRPIYIHGEVRKGGEHPYKAGITVRDAIALAGGYSYRADESYVILSRTSQAQVFRVRLPSDLKVMPGDNIRVPERFF